MSHITANGRRATVPCGCAFVLSSRSWFPYFHSQFLPVSYRYIFFLFLGKKPKCFYCIVEISCIQDRAVSQGCPATSLDSRIENRSCCQYWPSLKLTAASKEDFRAFESIAAGDKMFPSAWLQVVIQLSQPHIPPWKQPSNGISTITVHLFTAVMNQKQNLLFPG